jgi:hypothetical protein
MTAVRFVLVVALVASTARSQQNSPQEPSGQPQPAPPASCPITRRSAKEFIPPVPYKRDENSFWLGTEKLWTFLPERAIWEWARHQPGHEQEVQPLTTKIFWMRLGYDSRTEERPAIKVTGRQLDGPAPSLLGVAADQRLSRTWFCHADRCICTHSRLLGDHGRLPWQ